jgi:hypothetical protein
MKLQGSEVQNHETLQSQIGKIAENRLPISGLEIFHGRQSTGNIPAHDATILSQTVNPVRIDFSEGTGGNTRSTDQAWLRVRPDTPDKFAAFLSKKKWQDVIRRLTSRHHLDATPSPRVLCP